MRCLAFVFLLCILVVDPVWTQNRSRFDDSTAATTVVAQRYIDAYFSRRFDDIVTMMHPDISFEDPTAAFIFSGGFYAGKENVAAHFRAIYQSVHRMSPMYSRKIFSSNTAVFELTLEWTFSSSRGNVIHMVTPLVVVLTIHAGTVIAHRDYADYTTFIHSYNRQNE